MIFTYGLFKNVTILRSGSRFYLVKSSQRIETTFHSIRRKLHRLSRRSESISHQRKFAVDGVGRIDLLSFDIDY